MSSECFPACPRALSRPEALQGVNKCCYNPISCGEYTIPDRVDCVGAGDVLRAAASYSIWQ